MHLLYSTVEVYILENIKIYVYFYAMYIFWKFVNQYAMQIRYKHLLKIKHTWKIV